MAFAAKIIGTGSAFPERRMTNDDIARKLTEFGLATNDEWIRERTGIAERRISDVRNEFELNSSLGARAAQKALDMAGRKPEDIDQIIYATCSPDTPLPSTACWLQQKIGAHRAWAMDINAACSGFVYGLATADQFIRTGHTQTALVVGAEVLEHLPAGAPVAPAGDRSPPAHAEGLLRQGGLVDRDRVGLPLRQSDAGVLNGLLQADAVRVSRDRFILDGR